MSPRRAVRPRRQRRGGRPSTDASQITRSRTELAEDAAHGGLSVTHWLDADAVDPRGVATVRFSGRRDEIAGKPRPGDTFTIDERIDGVVPGSGPISVTTWAYGLNPGTWNVTAELLPAAGGGTRGGRTLPRAAWSWLRWRVSEGRFVPLATRWGPFVRLAPQPAVVPGSWIALVTLGVLVGSGVQLWLNTLRGIELGASLFVVAIAVLSGIVGAKAWYVVLRPRDWRRSFVEGWSIDGSVVAAPLGGAVAILALDLPLLAFLDGSAPAFFVGVGIGRIGCFLTGCCAGRCTASRWGIWSSDRRIGARRIPTQLMEAALGIGLALVFGGLLVLDATPFDGFVFVAGLIGYLGGRQALLRLRADARSSSLGMEGRRSRQAA